MPREPRVAVSLSEEQLAVLKAAVRREFQQLAKALPPRKTADKQRREDQTEPPFSRLNILFPPRLDTALDNICAEVRHTGGCKLTKTSIFRALVRFMLKHKPDFTKVRDEDDFILRLEQAAGAFNPSLKKAPRERPKAQD